MVRPIKHTVDYFPHDAISSNGRTLSILQTYFGHEGYSAWFKLLEHISATDNHVIDTRNPTKLEFLAIKMGFSPLRLNEILTKMAELDAIDAELWSYKIIWCQNFVNRIAIVYEKRKQPIPQKPLVDNNGVISTNNLVSDTNNRVSATESTQMIDKDKIVDKSKVNKKIVDDKMIDKSKESSLSDINNIFLLYDQHIKDRCPAITNYLQEYIKLYPIEWVAKAIEITGKVEKPCLRYVEAILETCQREGHAPEERKNGKKPKDSTDPNYYKKGKYGKVVQS